MFQLIVAPRAVKSSRRMPSHYKKRIAEVIDVLSKNPIPSELYDIKKLGGREDSYRIRIGDIRVSYTVMWNIKEVHVSEIEWRGSAYRR
ncbi:MAG: type II toxin-antitoxin system RelE family toxin [Candidatus Micrarchaeales archaeon]